MYPSRALDNAQGMFHMNSRKFSHRQFSSRDLSEGDEVWGFRKTGKRREGLYESSRAVNLVDGLPRAPSNLKRDTKICGDDVKMNKHVRQAPIRAARNKSAALRQPAGRGQVTLREEAAQLGSAWLQQDTRFLCKRYAHTHIARKRMQHVAHQLGVPSS